MRQHIYPGASLVVVDVVGTVAAELGIRDTSWSSAEMGHAGPLGIAVQQAQQSCDPMIIAHRFQSTVRVDLMRNDNCYGWIELTVRAAKDALRSDSLPTKRELGIEPEGHCSFSHTQVDLDRDPQFRLRYLLPRAQKMSKTGARFAKAEALSVTPQEETRLLLRSGGQRRGLTVCSSVGHPLLQIGVSASSTFGKPAQDLSAVLGVRATSINVYDFGAPPSKVALRDPRGAQSTQHANR